MSWLILPWAIQALVMAVDEFHFHRRRGLPRWERIGHPLDSLTVLACLSWIITQEASRDNLVVYGSLAAFSCLFVTKDELVHAEHCEPAEQWLHSVLFILHPICLANAAWLWRTRAAPAFLQAQTLVVFLFMIYQSGYWNWIWKPKTASTLKSTESSGTAGTPPPTTPSRSSARSPG